MKRCLIYCRVSTTEQARGDFTSINNQEGICQHAIALKEEEGWRHVKTISDPGYSGKDLSRPGITQALAEINAGMYDVVVVYKVDRVSRSLVKFYDFYQLLQEKDVAFYSATQSFDTSTSAGKLMLNMLLSFAEYERGIIMERTSDRMRANFERGKWNGGWVPFGYDYRPEDGILVAHAEEKDAIELLFTMLAEGCNPTRVADELNDRGFRTKRRELKTKNGETKVIGANFFNCDTVINMARNPIYIGKVRHGDKMNKGQHEGIIPENLFQKVNAKLGGNGKQTGVHLYNRDEHIHLLKGLIRCGDCGSIMTPFPSGKKDKEGKPYLYYTCTDVVHDKRRSPCNLRSLPARPFEKTVKQFLRCLAENQAILNACISEANKGKGDDLQRLEKKVKRLEKRISELTGQIRRFVEFLKTADAVSDEVHEEQQALVAEREKTKLHLEMAQVELSIRQREHLDIETIKGSLRMFDKVIDCLSLEDQKELMHLLIKEIRVNQVGPKKRKTPSEEGAFICKLRTRLVEVNISLYEIPSLPVSYDTGEQKFVIQSDWLRDQDSNLGPSG